MNSNETEWVTIRDLKNNLVYDGWIKAFSEDSRNPEILLRDVTVYNNSSAEELYEIDAQYLKLDSECISVEVRKKQEVQIR